MKHPPAWIDEAILSAREHNSRPIFDPKTDSQRLAAQLFPASHVLFLSGAAGTGKTRTAVGLAAGELLAERVKKIIVLRPLVEAGERLGFLPGDQNEKIAPYARPLYEMINQLGQTGRTGAVDLIKASTEMIPIGYIRGLNFDHCVVVVDEAQNCTLSQFALILSRMGTNCKMIVTGDPKQSDLPYASQCFADVLDGYESANLGGVAVVRMPDTEIVRNPLIAALLSVLGRVPRR